MTALHAIGAVVRCGDAVAGLYNTVSSLADASRVVVVIDPSTPAPATDWLTAFTRQRACELVRVDSMMPGVAWNAGLAACGPAELAICVEAGDVIAPSGLSRMRGSIVDNPSIRFVTTAIEWLGPGPGRSISSPSDCSPDAILSNTLDVHISSLFRWAMWNDGIRFDEELPCLEHADFWLRMLADGGAFAIESQPCLKRRIHDRALYKRAWLTNESARAAEIVFKRHSSQIHSIPDLLASKEQLLQRQHQRHEHLNARIRNAEAQTHLLRARVDALRPSSGPIPDIVERQSPMSHDWGYARGIPVDRPFIERFLSAYRHDVRGRVLEIQEDDYTRALGGPMVTQADVLDLAVDNPRATLVADLRAVSQVSDDTYDCVILTQTLHVIDDMPAVVRECHRLLKPGGVLLATLPSSSRVCLEYGPDADFWRVTDAGARRVFETAFLSGNVETVSLGNAPANAAFAMGLSGTELVDAALRADDPYFPLLVGVCARKSLGSGAPAVWRSSQPASAILMYHRVSTVDLDPHRMNVSPAHFESQLAWLRDTCTVAPLSTVGRRTERLRPRTVAIAFDDGYIDNLQNAVPQLVQYDVPATFFLTTAEGPEPFVYWWDRLAELLRRGSRHSAEIALDLPSGRVTLPVTTETHWRLYRELVALPLAERNAVMAAVDEWAGQRDATIDDRRMNLSEAKELARHRQFDIGAHTVNHLLLPAQPDHVVAHEMVECRNMLRERFDRDVDSFAYPYGAFDTRTIGAARDAGYVVAVSCESRGVGQLDDPLALPRIDARDEPLDAFIARVQHALENDAR